MIRQAAGPSKADILRAELDLRAGCPFRTYFPDTGPLRRALYPRSMLFFTASRFYKERMFLGANRASKTVTGGYELTAHTTGQYPAWWPGARFATPTQWWCAGDTRETTRDILQKELCGAREFLRRGRWGGMLPGEFILDRSLKTGIADAVDMLWIQHVERHHGANLVSTIQFKSYDQGREVFQGATLSGGVWLDEEPPDATETPDSGGTPSGNGDVYTECLLRVATTAGLILSTMTPLRGLTPFVEQYLSTADMCDAEGQLVNAKVGIFGKAA